MESKEENTIIETTVERIFMKLFRKKYNLIVTDIRVILMHKSMNFFSGEKPKRMVMLEDLKGITKSTLSGANCFVIHVKNSHDEYLFCSKMSKVIDAIKEQYAEVCKQNLPIFGIAQANLKCYRTKEKDAALGISRMPFRKFRLKSERVLDAESSGDDEDSDLDDDFEVIDREEIDKINEFLQTYNKPEIIQEEKDKIKEEDKSELLFAKEADDPEQTGQDGQPKSLDDFIILQVIDKGSFGKVFLVKNKLNNKYYAMKRIRKDILVKKNQLENNKNEKEILLKVRHPFLLGMDYVFQNEQRVYFFLDYIPGGNLFENLFSLRRFSEDIVKFISAQLILAFKCLHENNVVHRDLKPENVLFQESGYIKLADFGLAKFLDTESQSTHSFCGTAEYLAPEILDQTGHSFTVDWWTLGILVYELRTGRPPFLDKNNHKLGLLIKKGKIIFPDPVKHKIDMSEEMKDFIMKLLDRNPETRLGAKGYQEVMDHPWLEGVDFDKILKQEEPAPFKPIIKRKITDRDADIESKSRETFIESHPKVDL